MEKKTLSESDIERNATALLRRFYGYDSFRPRQLEVITAAMQGRDTLVLMPTGGGKSICYQIPALLGDGIVVVVSPLIALMNDQVAALSANGIPAAAVHSNRSDEENRHIMEAIIDARVKILYISPERLIADMPRWSSQIPVKLFAIDEAHCVSQWGHDFRPDYVKLAAIKKIFPGVPVMALTATADALTRTDIVQRLALDNPLWCITSFDRPNISLAAELNPGSQQRINRISAIIRRYATDSGIVYCMSRKSTESTARELAARGFKAEPYHAGMSPDDRERVQHRFIAGELQAVCATVAFGMGIDKSNIRWVVHNNLPANLESYYQEIGRAGRDGLPAEALMFYSWGDVITLRQRADESGRPAVNHAKLERMLEYARTGVCRRRVLLNYFNEPSGHDCGNCDVCLNPPHRFDGTIIAQKALSAVLRTGRAATLPALVDILRGYRSAEIVSRGWDRIKTFGAGHDLPATAWRYYLSQLMQLGMLEPDSSGHLVDTPMGRGILRPDTERVTMALYEPQRNTISSAKKAVSKPELLELLRDQRSRIAKKEGVPAYIVFSDKTLIELERRRPIDIEAFSAVEGISETKTIKYWRQFTTVIRRYLGLPAIPPGANSERLTLMLYQAGHNPGEIARNRSLALSTVYGHLTSLVKADKIDDLSRLMPRDTFIRLMNLYRPEPTSFISRLADPEQRSLGRLAIAISDALLRRRGH